MDKRNTVLISFLNHRETDGRVFYRETRYILDEIGNEVNVEMISLDKSASNTNFSVEIDHRIYNGHEIKIHRIKVPSGKSIIDKIRISRRQHKMIRKELKTINPVIYFLADVRELSDAVNALATLETAILYDSHEDYPLQALNYGKGVLKYIRAAIFNLTELTIIPKCTAVFCTDESLYEKYRKKRFHAKNVYLLRNYPYYDSSIVIERSFEKTTKLKMVYIGGVDKYRGIIESAEYIAKFNSEHPEYLVTLDIYGNDTDVARMMKNNKFVSFHDWIDQNALMEKLRTEYDVGLCLWQPIPKFYLNLPIKNFDYMGAGLPFITSNFGNLKIHAEKSKAGYCINPNSYEDFARATQSLFNPDVRKEFYKNGLKYVKDEAAFQVEGKPLIDVMRKVLEGARG